MASQNIELNITDTYGYIISKTGILGKYICIYIGDGSVVSFQKTAVAVLASVVVFLKTAVAVLMRLC